MVQMGDSNRKVHALGLISGGLDSTLAAALMLEQGIEVSGMNFYTGFCLIEHHRLMGRRDDKTQNPALKTERRLLFPVETVDISKEYLDLVTNPRYGYGKNANPCIDCRIMMLRKAKIMMERTGADFIFTGEVLGQRPMTQMRRTLDLIERRAEMSGRLLRPLSAKLLPETIPEAEGLVERSKLKDFQGRSRKPQIALAEELGVTDYPAPAGGCCFLTDPGYGRKFFDLLDHRAKRALSMEDFTILKVGRHLRVKADLKVVVGRNQKENEFLRRFTPRRVSFEVIDTPGPLTLLEGADTEENRSIAAAITARYSDAPLNSAVKVRIVDSTGETALETVPTSPENTSRWVIR